MQLDSKPDPIRGARGPAAFSSYLFRCWYVTNGTMTEAVSFRDALDALLHLQAQSLVPQGLYTQWIECVDSHVMLLSDVNKTQAYLEFEVIA